MILADTSNFSNDQVLLALIAFMSLTTTGFFTLIRSQSNSADKHNKAMVKSNDNNTKALNRIATSTEKGNAEAEKRNGHLAELVVQQGENTKAIATGAVESIIGAVQNIPEQHIEHAHVEHQEIVEIKKK